MKLNYKQSRTSCNLLACVKFGLHGLALSSSIMIGETNTFLWFKDTRLKATPMLHGGTTPKGLS